MCADFAKRQPLRTDVEGTFGPREFIDLEIDPCQQTMKLG